MMTDRAVAKIGRVVLMSDCAAAAAADRGMR